MNQDPSRLSAAHPFAGLRPFDFADSEFFFGRDTQILSLYRLVDRSRFVAVVGSSGSGKSSLVRAGLLPLLEKESADVSGPTWDWIILRPGNRPLNALADGLAELASRTQAPASEVDPQIRRDLIGLALERSSYGLAKALDQVPGASGKSLLLVIDQFEELFRYANPEGVRGRAGDSQWRNEAAHFVQLLLEGSRTPSRPVHVLITMRSDFIGDCAQFQGLPEAVSASQFLVPSLTRDQREDVIRKPLEKAGATIDSTLVERLLNDAGAELDHLPVLQHCLSRLWEGSGAAHHLTLRDYRALGGMSGALSQHADAVMASLPGRELAVEQTFRALSEVDKEGRATRRAISFAQLVAESGLPEEQIRETIDRFRADDCSFIVTAPAVVPVLQPETRVDVVHEALLRGWKKISAEPQGTLTDEVAAAGWLFAEESDGRYYRALLELLERKSASGKVTLPLDQVEDSWKWWTERPRTQAWAERYEQRKPGEASPFKRVSQLFEDSLAALAAEETRRQHEEQLEHDRVQQQIEMESLRARAAQTLAHRTRAAAIALACIALLAIALGAFGLVEGAQAKKSAQQAQASEAAAKISDSQAQRMAADERASASAMRESMMAQSADLKIAQRQTQLARRQTQLARQQTRVADNAKATTQTLAATQRRQVESSQLAEIDRTMNGSMRNGFDARIAGLVGAAAYRESPTMVGRDALLEAAESPGALGRLALPPWSLGAVAGKGDVVAVLAGQRQSGYDRPVTGSLMALGAFPLRVLSKTSGVRASLLCGFDSAPQVAIAAPGRIERYDLSAPSGPALTASRSVGAVRAMDCSREGESVVYADDRNTLRELDFATGKERSIVRVPGAALNGIRLSPSGRLAAVTLADGTVAVYSLRSAKRLSETHALTDAAGDCSPVAGCAEALAFSYDEKHLAWYDDGRIHVAPVGALASAGSVYPCPASSCARPLLVFQSATTSFPSVVGLGRYADEPTDAGGSIHYAKVYDNLSGALPPHALWDRELNLYLTEYAPAAAGQPNPFGSGIAVESFSDISAPMLGAVPGSQWSESYVLRGHYLLVPQARGDRFISYDLLHLREGFDKIFNVSYDVRVRDSGDGVHAITFNYETGVARVLDMRGAPQRRPVLLHQFSWQRVPVDKTGHYLRYVQIAYDPRSRIVTLLSNAVTSGKGMQGGELRRFSLDGRPLSALSEDRLARAAGVSSSAIAWWYLSQRGNYVSLHTVRPNPDVMLDANGKRIGSAYQIVATSPDETFALGFPKAGLATRYFLPSWSTRGVMPMTTTTTIGIEQYTAIAPDGRTIAYLDSEQGNGDRVQLLDVGSQSNYSYFLPNPPVSSTLKAPYVGLAFSADSRFLLVTYYVADGVPQTAVYSLDPDRWAQAVCVMSGRSLTASEFRTMFPGISYRDPCAPYAAQMYRP